jgi:hypothetical protein
LQVEEVFLPPVYRHLASWYRLANDWRQKSSSKALVASLVLLAFTDVVLAQYYVEPSNIARASIYPRSFESKHHTKHAREKQRALDAAHKAALSKIPDQPQPTDPWAKVRP